MTTTRAIPPLLILVAVLAVPTLASAQARLSFIPSLSVFTVYDDNLFARVEGSAGQMLEVRPTFEGNYDSPTKKLLGLFSIDLQRSNHASLNTLDARRHALATAEVRTTPRTTMGISLRYDRTETPGELEIDTGLLGERRQAERWQASPTLSHRWNVRTTTSASYDWMTENLVEGERGTLHVARMALTRELSERSSVSGSYVGRAFLDGFDGHSSHAALLGWTMEIAPETRISFAAGPKTTTYQGLAPEVSAAFARTTNRLRIALDYQHGETIVLGIRGPVAVDSATARITSPVRRTLELGLHGGISDIATLDSRKTTIYRGTVVGSWSPRRSIYTVAASFGLDAQRGTIRRATLDGPPPPPPGSYIFRQVFRVGLTIAPRLSHSMLPPDEAARAKGVAR